MVLSSKELDARPVQIVASTDEDLGSAPRFDLRAKALEEILSKVPKDMLVSVVSVVGAFRTGKSFLLTLFLRYLRHSSQTRSGSGSAGGRDVDFDVENWLYAEGEKIAEGNNNQSGDCSEEETSSENAKRSPTEGFAWRGGQDRMTTGIWMWSEPFIHYSPVADTEVAVLLMDTQGMFDNETTMNLTAQIFGISTLVSSFQIYNVQNSIGEDKLMHLALFSEYGRIALQPSPSSSSTSRAETLDKHGEDDGSGDDDAADTGVWRDRKGELSDEEDTKEKERPFHFEAEMTSSILKPFQSLLFLVRDWPNFDDKQEEVLVSTKWESTDRRLEIEEKFLDEMRSYFRSVIGIRGQSDLQSTRDQIARCFESVSAFLLPHPGTSVTKKNFNGSLSVLDPVFTRLIGLLARTIFEECLEPKRIHTRDITAPELLAYFQVYTELFKNDSKNFPPAMTMLDATADANNRNAYDLAFTKYKECLDAELVDKAGYLSQSDLRELHEDAVQNAWRLFKSIANMGSRKAIEKLGLKLNDDIQREYRRAAETNDLRNPYRAFEYYIFPILIGVASWVSSVIIHYSCTTETCNSIKGVLGNVYGYLFVIGMIVFWQHIRMALKHVGIYMGGGTNVSLYSAGGQKVNTKAVKRKAD